MWSGPHKIGLTAHCFRVVGLDVSRDALACTPDSVRAIVASAEEMVFPDASFDVVLHIVSLQFIENYRTYLSEPLRYLSLAED